MTTDMDTRSALDRLAGAFTLIPVSDAASPVHLSVALPSDSSALGLESFPEGAAPEAGRVANGRGWDAEGCRLSALGEAAELLSCCEWGDEELIHASAVDLGPRALTAGALIGLSEQQYMHRDDWNSELGGFDWRPRPCGPRQEIAWQEVEDASTGERFFAPADYMLIGRRESGDQQAVAIADSNGCACGPDLETAKLNAVLELIERDAVSRWWYGQRRRSELVPAASPQVDALSDWLEKRDRGFKLIDVRSDIAVPAVVAVSADGDGTNVCLSSAAAMSWPFAISSALSELAQMEFSLELARQAPGMSQTWDLWRKTVTMATPPLGLVGGKSELPDGKGASSAGQGLSACLSACRAAGVMLYLRNTSRQELGVPAARAVSPDLCAYKPRFGRARLLVSDTGERPLTGITDGQRNPVYLVV